ncbi:MAG: hypothetical protein WCC00_09585 [Candidatus Aminicenantales bacterium]
MIRRSASGAKLEGSNLRSYIFLALVLLSLLTLLLKRADSPSDGTRETSTSTLLPDFSATDLNGKTIKDEDFSSHYVFVEFLDPNDDNDAELLRAVASAWKTHSLAVMGIIRGTWTPTRDGRVNSEHTIIIPDGAQQLSSAFNVPMNLSAFLLYDDDGKLIIRGNTYEGYEKRIKIELARALIGRRFVVADIAREGSRLNDMPWLGQLQDLMNPRDKDYYLFALFTSLCASCQEGAIITDLNNIYLAKRPYLEVLSIVYSKHLGVDDLGSLREQARMPYPVVPANLELSEKWASQIELYNSNMLNNILILVDREGWILKVHDATCRCYNEFMNMVRSMEPKTNQR